MLTRSLFYSNKYFASTSFKVLKQGFIIPQPPKKPQTELVIFTQLVRQSKLLHGQTKNLKNVIHDQNFGVQQRQEAKALREKQVKEYENSLTKYENTFTYPKRSPTAVSFFVKEKFTKTKEEKTTDVLKKLTATYKSLSESEKEVYIQKAKQDRQRYLNELKQFEQRNSSWKIPQFYSISGYLIYVQEQFAINPKLKLAEISSAWKTVSETDKKAYEHKAELAKEAQKQKLAEFQKKHNIPDEVVKSLYKRKPRAHSEEQKK